MKKSPPSSPTSPKSKSPGRSELRKNRIGNDYKLLEFRWQDGEPKSGCFNFGECPTWSRSQGDTFGGVATCSECRLDKPCSEGRVIIASGDSPACSVIQADDDICAGVSYYKLSNIPADTKGGEHSELIGRFEDVVLKNSDEGLFVDHSKYKGLCCHDKKDRSSLGDVNCFISLVKVPSKESLGHAYALVVRSYDKEKSGKVASVVCDRAFTIDKLYKSELMRDALNYGRNTRDIVAAKVAKAMGFGIKCHAPGQTSAEDPEIVELAIPQYECIYNTLEKVEGLKGESALYAYYHNCYSSSRCNGGVILNSPVSGDIQILLNQKSREQKDTLGAIPMCYPLKPKPEYEPARDGSKPARDPSANVMWGGCLDFNLNKGALVADHSHRAKSAFQDTLISLGYTGSPIHCKQLAAYISTPCESYIPIDTICAKTSRDTVTIPASHQSLKDLLDFSYVITKDHDLTLSRFFVDAQGKPGHVDVNLMDLQRLSVVLEAIGINRND